MDHTRERVRACPRKRGNDRFARSLIRARHQKAGPRGLEPTADFDHLRDRFARTEDDLGEPDAERAVMIDACEGNRTIAIRDRLDGQTREHLERGSRRDGSACDLLEQSAQCVRPHAATRVLASAR
jgi:hypothetical protein